MKFVAVKVGCLECYIASELVGVFPDKAAALKVAEELNDTFGTDERCVVFEWDGSEGQLKPAAQEIETSW